MPQLKGKRLLTAFSERRGSSQLTLQGLEKCGEEVAGEEGAPQKRAMGAQDGQGIEGAERSGLPASNE